MRGNGPHVVVVGAGVVGISTAYFLAARGARVTVLDRGDVAGACSFGNSGLIVPGHAPLCRPGLFDSIRPGDPRCPFYIAAPGDAQAREWLTRFRAACTQEHFEHAMNALGALGPAAQCVYDTLLAEEGIECDYRADGSYDVYRTEAALEHGAREAAGLAKYGVGAEVLDGETMHRREPSLRTKPAGAVHFTMGGTLDPHRFNTGLAERAQARGVEFRTGVSVSTIATLGGRATGVGLASGETVSGDFVVLAAGVWTGDLLEPLGVHVPLMGAKGLHLDLAFEGELPVRHGVKLAEGDFLCTPMGSFVRLSGLVEISDWRAEVDARRLEMITAPALREIDGLDRGREVSRWCGLRPCTPDGLPVVGPAPRVDRLLVGAGHARLGQTLGPLTGKLLAEMALDGAASMDVSALRVGRF